MNLAPIRATTSATDPQPEQRPLQPETNSPFPAGFEEDDALRSEFIRQLARTSLHSQQAATDRHATGHAHAAPDSSIPRTLVRFWHDSKDIPADVQACLDSWTPLRDEGVIFRMFDDDTAAAYIARQYGPSQVAAFARCRHPAMRSDYLRMCFVLAEGGLYVDADDVLLDDGWRRVFRDNTLEASATVLRHPSSHHGGGDRTRSLRAPRRRTESSTSTTTPSLHPRATRSYGVRSFVPHACSSRALKDLRSSQPPVPETSPQR